MQFLDSHRNLLFFYVLSTLTVPNNASFCLHGSSCPCVRSSYMYLWDISDEEYIQNISGYLIWKLPWMITVALDFARWCLEVVRMHLMSQQPIAVQGSLRLNSFTRWSLSFSCTSVSQLHVDVGILDTDLVFDIFLTDSSGGNWGSKGALWTYKCTSI